MNKVGRNDPCPCGSGKKFKKCCLDKPFEPSPELLADFELGQQRIREDESNAKRPSSKATAAMLASVALTVGGFTNLR
jgi:hypothetical protein